MNKNNINFSIKSVATLILSVVLAWLLSAIVHVVEIPFWFTNRFNEEYSNGSVVMAIHASVVAAALSLLLFAIRSEKSLTRISKTVGVATPSSLGFIRFVVCGILFFDVLSQDLAGTADLPEEMRVHLGINKILHKFTQHFDTFLSSHALLDGWQLLTEVSLFLAMLGLLSRITLPLSALSYLILGGVLRAYSHNFHTGLIPSYCLYILVFTPCSDGFSLDRIAAMIRGKATVNDNQSSECYAQARFCVWLVVDHLK